jgi:hypothetical protein
MICVNGKADPAGRSRGESGSKEWIFEFDARFLLPFGRKVLAEPIKVVGFLGQLTFYPVFPTGIQGQSSARISARKYSINPKLMHSCKITTIFASDHLRFDLPRY